MITYKTGNLLDDDADALVNTVNTVGVMGKGLAFQFKQRFPAMAEEYSRRCRFNIVEVGTMDVHRMPDGQHIINFPTKRHWRNRSRVDWIQRGLDDLAFVIEHLRIKSIALPKLGSGLGGLDWDNEVHPLVIEAFGDMEDVDVRVYSEPPKVER